MNLILLWLNVLLDVNGSNIIMEIEDGLEDGTCAGQCDTISAFYAKFMHYPTHSTIYAYHTKSGAFLIDDNWGQPLLGRTLPEVSNTDAIKKIITSLKTVR